MFATDSILTTRPFIEESNELGGWKKETEGEAVVLMTGIYTIRDGDKKKSRFRGFPMKEDFDLFDILHANKNCDKIAINFEKAVKLGEVVAFHNIYQLSDLNVFMEEMKEISCFSDDKRDWLGQPVNFGDLLNNEYDSVPKTVQDKTGLAKRRTYSGYTKSLYDWHRSREFEELNWLIERMHI
jgi:hypothetical protein